MNKNFKVILPIACLVLVSLACQFSSGTNVSTPQPVEPQPATEKAPPQPTQPQPTIDKATSQPTQPQPQPSPMPVADKTLLNDDFSVHWGLAESDNGTIKYGDEDLVFTVLRQNWVFWTSPNQKTYQNVHIEVTGILDQADPDTSLGITCNRQLSEDSYNLLVITPAGEYAIAKYPAGEDMFFFTNDDKWAISDLISQNAPSYRIGADCGNGVLTLYVDGKQIDSVSDSTYTSGAVGVIVWSGANATNTVVTFDDFLLTKLP